MHDRAPRMLFGHSEPGHGKLLVLDDGVLVVELEPAPAEFLECGPNDTAGSMERGNASYGTVWRETVERGT